MNIRQRRLQVIIQQILREELQRGNLPTSREFIQKVRDYIYSKGLEKPTLTVRGVREKAVARAEDVNSLVDQSNEDLRILYESIIGKYDTALKNFNKFDVDKTKLDYELNKLENQLKELILLYGESGFLTSVYDVFDDVSKVDVDKSSVEINIKAHEATLLQSKNMSYKMATDSAMATFSLSPSTKEVMDSRKTIGEIRHGLSDNIDEVWAEVIYLKESKGQVEGIYEIQFDEEMFCNNIELELHSGKAVELDIEYSPHGKGWKKVPFNEKEVKSEGTVTYHFDHVHMQKFRIKMKKAESDHSIIRREGEAQTILYAYLLGIKKVGFYQTGYADTGELYSKPLIPITKNNQSFTINKVSLHADEVIPNGSSIDYFVAINPDTPGKEPEWKRISPVNKEAPKHDQIIDFKNITRAPAQPFMVDPEISIGEYRLESLYANGINFYRLGDIEERKIVEGTESLFVGKNTWGVKKYEYDYGTNHIPSLKDWNAPPNAVTESFSPMTDGEAGILLNQAQHTAVTNYMITLGVFSRKADQTVSATPVSLDPIAIYMNGEKIFEGIPTPNTKVNYLFKPGWNEIKIVAYVSRTVNQTEGATVSINFDPREQGAYVYAKPRSLEKVSLFDLRYNVKSNDYSKYAIMETNGRYTIVLNHIIPGLEYDFYCEYIDGEPKNEILFKAVMKLDRSITELTPKLRGYRLRFS